MLCYAVIPVQTVSAWTGTLPTCGGMPQYDWSARIKAVYNFDIDWDKDTVVAYRFSGIQGGNGTSINGTDGILINVLKPLSPATSVTGGIATSSGVSAFTYDHNATPADFNVATSKEFDMHLISSTAMPGQSQGQSMGSYVSCIQSVHNVKYFNNTEGQFYSEDMGADEQEMTFGGFFTRTKDVQNGIWTAMQNNVGSKWDYLRLPYDVITGSIGHFTTGLTDGNATCYVGSGFGTNIENQSRIFGSSWNFDFCSMSTTQPTAWAYMQNAFRAVIILSLMGAMLYQYRRVMDNG